MNDEEFKFDPTNKPENIDEFVIGEENEPYLGPSWAIMMFVLYLLKLIFPADDFSLFWWFQLYIVLIVFGITIFTLVKRYYYFNE